MAVNQDTTAREIGRTFVESLGPDPMIDGVFVEAEDRVIVWLLTRPISFDEETRFYEAGAALHRQFCDTTIDLRVINPSFFDPEIELVGEVIPSSAEPVTHLHAE